MRLREVARDTMHTLFPDRLGQQFEVTTLVSLVGGLVITVTGYAAQNSLEHRQTWNGLKDTTLYICLAINGGNIYKALANHRK